jgi:Family of unknown function (DUF5701)
MRPDRPLLASLAVVPAVADKTAELDRQLETLISRSAAGRASIDAAGLRDAARRLGHRLPAPAGGSIPFVLVPGRDVVPPATAAAAIEREGRDLIWMLDADELERFMPIGAVEVPDAPAYLLTEVEPVGQTLGRTPDDSLTLLERAGRSPLTLDEGIALATQFPDAIAPNACFQMPGSRCGDRRIPSLWLSGGSPKLGWCYAGAPHTWLGTASCEKRLS